MSVTTAAAYGWEYRKHSASMQQGAKRWRFQGRFLLCTMAGLMFAALKCAFFLAFRWQQKSPEVEAAPPSSALLSSLTAGYYQVFAVYRLLKPVAFSLSLITRVLVLSRMLSLISSSKSPRLRQTAGPLTSFFQHRIPLT